FENRVQREVGERRRMCRFGATVTGDPPLTAARREELRDQRGRGHHGPVEEARCPAYGGLGEEPGHRREVGARYPTQEGDGVPHVALPPEHGVADGRGLAHPSLVVDPGPATHQFDRLATGY